MANATVARDRIFKILKQNISGSKDEGIFDVKYEKMPGMINTAKHLQIKVLGDDRPGNRRFVKSIMTNDLKLKVKQTKHASSTFESLLVTGYITEGRNEVGCIIFFKYADGKSVDTTRMWNKQLLNVFKRKPKLKRTPRNRDEVNIITKINQKLKDIAPCKVRLASGTYDDIIGAIGGESLSHADIILVNSKGDEKAFITYKKGESATSFQQYSGISANAGSSINKHKEVVDWRNLIGNNWDDIGHDVYRSISDKGLKEKAVFGHEGIGNKSSQGKNKCSVFAQGEINFSGGPSDVLDIHFTKHSIHHVGDLTGNYAPTLGARKGEANRKVSADVKAPGKSGSSRGVRGGIFTKEYMSSRRGSEERTSNNT